MGAAIYRSDPDAARDSGFAPGELRHLVVGNRGRLLDARRTPVTVTSVSPGTGAFEVEIGAFEDSGARWELPLQDINRFQFALTTSRAASPGAIAALERSAARFDRELVVECDPEARAETLRRIAAERQTVKKQLGAQDPDQLDVAQQIAQRVGRQSLFALLDAAMAARGLADLDELFTAAFVSNPRSGEFVKGHAIVLAELGLSPYRGQVVRNPTVFAGSTSKSRRAEHLIARLAFAQELWASLGYESVVLYRGMAAEGPLRALAPSSFLSATFSREVATEHFEGGPATKSAALWRQDVPVSRLVMTFLETRGMSSRFKEAEAVLLAEPRTGVF
ncbi:MAG: hypothetical protein JO120_02410 [Solirubrobacterales bacterium]|nr:hypothetical protein [Solirubrobacterales bacterium]